jgi:uncharacterized membrane protein
MMIRVFILTLFLTFIIVRILAYIYHDRRNYGTKKEKSLTLTGYLRKKTGYDFHHFHFGLIILIITLILIWILKINMVLIIMLGISLSMILDQIIPFFNRKSNYFSKQNFIISLIFHIILSILALIIYY